MEKKAELFHSDGFVTLENVLDISLIEKLFQLSNDNFDEIMKIIQLKDLAFGIGAKFGFKEIVQRHTGRFEMPYKMDNDLINQVSNNHTIRSLVEDILGADAVIINKSVVMCMPGAQNQAWHSDGSHVCVDKHLPCHVLNVFIPLIDLTKELGPTEFKPGLYRHSINISFLLTIIIQDRTYILET